MKTRLEVIFETLIYKIYIIIIILFNYFKMDEYDRKRFKKPKAKSKVYKNEFDDPKHPINFPAEEIHAKIIKSKE